MIWRLLIGFVTIIVTLTVLWVLEEREGAQSEPAYCVSEQMRESIRKMSVEAVDEAYKKHVMLLFDVWVKDTREQPRRAQNGMQTAISAYVRARKDALAWNPEICK